MFTTAERDGAKFTWCVDGRGGILCVCDVGGGKNREVKNPQPLGGSFLLLRG